MCNFAPIMMYSHDNLKIITKKNIRARWKKDFFSATRL